MSRARNPIVLDEYRPAGGAGGDVHPDAGDGDDDAVAYKGIDEHRR